MSSIFRILTVPPSHCLCVGLKLSLDWDSWDSRWIGTVVGLGQSLDWDSHWIGTVIGLGQSLDWDSSSIGTVERAV